jgi:hypothetical protein
MNDRTAKVLAGLTSLSKEETNELLIELKKYNEGLPFEKRAMNEAYSKTFSVVLGPTSGGCPCCGR